MVSCVGAWSFGDVACRGGYLRVLPDLRLLAIADDGANELVERVLRGEARLPERLTVVGVVSAVVSCAQPHVSTAAAAAAAANDQSINRPIESRVEGQRYLARCRTVLARKKKKREKWSHGM